ncbi:MAG: calcium-binding protein [Sedimentitalea sp.]
MAISLRLPKDGSLTFADVFEAFEIIFIDGAPGGDFDGTGFSGTGFFGASEASFTATGSDLSFGTLFNQPYIITGTIDEVIFKVDSGGRLKFVDFDLDMASFALTNFYDEFFTEPNGDMFAIEDHFMKEDWILFLSTGDDMIVQGSLVGDGAALNLLGDDIIRAKAGDDIVDTGKGDDRVFAGAGDDTVTGGAGEDDLRGGGGRDDINGGVGDDTLQGNSGKDLVNGGGGNDKIDVGEGNDTATGGAGSDRFVFKDGYGKNIVTDFDATDDAEDVDLRGLSEITGYFDLKTNHMVQNGNDVVIEDGQGVRITLTGVDLNDINGVDFLF